MSETSPDDNSDLIAYDRAIAEGGESFPCEFVKRLIAGESPVRVFRDLRGFTQAELSRISGVQQVEIADIEAGRRNGSIRTMEKLASALSVTADDLI